MSAITDELKTVAKNLTVATSKTASYKAVSERDILDAVKPLEHKYGVYSYPVGRTVLESNLLESESEYNGKVTKKTTFMTRIATVYRFVNVEKPEEYIETITFAEGIDAQDKGSGKAMTYGDKYALMKAYKISTGSKNYGFSGDFQGKVARLQWDLFQILNQFKNQPLIACGQRLKRGNKKQLILRQMSVACFICEELRNGDMQGITQTINRQDVRVCLLAIQLAKRAVGDECILCQLIHRQAGLHAQVVYSINNGIQYCLFVVGFIIHKPPMARLPNQTDAVTKIPHLQINWGTKV